MAKPCAPLGRTLRAPRYRSTRNVNARSLRYASMSNPLIC